jgi:hypothetical protein
VEGKTKTKQKLKRSIFFILSAERGHCNPIGRFGGTLQKLKYFAVIAKRLVVRGDKCSFPKNKLMFS